jgi:sporulation protein YlmC with PRC-barrel domain
MNSQPMANNLKKVRNKAGIQNLLENLKNKVRNFSVTDQQGQIVGRVKDLILDANRRLNLVISQQGDKILSENGNSNRDSHRSILLLSQRINKIDNCTKSILLDIDQSELELMPEYLETEPTEIKKATNTSSELGTNISTSISQGEIANVAEVDEENIVRLIEERLIADSSKRKLGEVIVRKEIETRMMHIPVRREKLIVEQVSPESKQLAEIDLNQGEISGVEFLTGESPEGTILDGHLTVHGKFISPKIASLLLNAIALEKNHGCQQVKITIAVTDESLQEKYQEWFDRCSKGQKPNA